MAEMHGIRLAKTASMDASDPLYGQLRGSAVQWKIASELPV
jgi:hypothetical protein